MFVVYKHHAGCCTVRLARKMNLKFKMTKLRFDCCIVQCTVMLLLTAGARF